MSDAMFRRMQAEQIQRLKAELKKYEWISVNDRLPDEYENVLTYGERPSYDVVYVNRLIDKENGEWLYDGVTHWMPLPKIPKENEDERFRTEHRA